MNKRLIATIVLAGQILVGCGTVFGDNDRTIPARNHRLCGVAGGTVVADAILLFFAVAPGVAAFAIDHVTGALCLSDKECAGE